jgi:hypothetical protein
MRSLPGDQDKSTSKVRPQPTSTLLRSVSRPSHSALSATVPTVSLSPSSSETMARSRTVPVSRLASTKRMVARRGELLGAELLDEAGSGDAVSVDAIDADRAFGGPPAGGGGRQLANTTAAKRTERTMNHPRRITVFGTRSA